MTERELQADLRALIRRWEGRIEDLGPERHRESYEQGEGTAIEDCIADVKELLP